MSKKVSAKAPTKQPDNFIDHAVLQKLVHVTFTNLDPCSGCIKCGSLKLEWLCIICDGHMCERCHCGHPNGHLQQPMVCVISTSREMVHNYIEDMFQESMRRNARPFMKKMKLVQKQLSDPKMFNRACHLNQHKENCQCGYFEHIRKEQQAKIGEQRKKLAQYKRAVRVMERENLTNENVKEHEYNKRMLDGIKYDLDLITATYADIFGDDDEDDDEEETDDDAPSDSCPFKFDKNLDYKTQIQDVIKGYEQCLLNFRPYDFKTDCDEPDSDEDDTDVRYPTLMDNYRQTIERF